MKKIILIIITIALTTLACEINYDSKNGKVTYTDNKSGMLVSFYFDDITNGLGSDAVGEINGKQVLVTVPRGTAKFLTPTIISTGNSVEIQDVNSNGTVDITNTIIFTITGENYKVETYYVYVNEAPEGSKEILSFKFVDAGISGEIDGLDIYVYLPAGIEILEEEPRIRHTGISVECERDNPTHSR